MTGRQRRKRVTRQVLRIWIPKVSRMQRFKPASKQSTRRGSKPGLKVFRNNKAKASQEQKEHHLTEVGEAEGERVRVRVNINVRHKLKVP